MNIAISPKHQNTRIFIDVSNIRAACLKTLNFMIDFYKLFDYFQQKYHQLQEVRYYEGIASGDSKKLRVFESLASHGYTICPLERKSYNAIITEEQNIKCPNCGNQWVKKFTKAHKSMKSNVDVYLATELLTIAHRVSQPTHIILVSCDGDYAEMIKNALENPHVSISVLATPPAKDIKLNTLSARLRLLRKNTPRYQLTNIASIAKLIKQNLATKKRTAPKIHPHG